MLIILTINFMTILYSHVIIELLVVITAEYAINLSGIYVMVREWSQTICSMMRCAMTALYDRVVFKNYLFMLRIFGFTTCIERVFKERVSQTVMLFIETQRK